MTIHYPRTAVVSQFRHATRPGFPRQPAVLPMPTPIPTPAPAPVRLLGRGRLRLDPGRRTAAVDGHELDLTFLEFELLAHLVAHPFQVLSRRQLLASVWGQSEPMGPRTVDVHVARLRRKLGPLRDAIATVRRIGYSYQPATPLRGANI